MRLVLRLFFTALLYSTLPLEPLQAQAQASLLRSFGGPSGFGTRCFQRNDDGSSRALDLTPYFPSGLRFFDQTHTELFLNTNGNVTFAAPLFVWTPAPFPIAEQPMIAPYWGDVDIRGSSCGGSYNCGGGACDQDCSGVSGDNQVWYAFVEATESDPARMVATWDRVGYYACSDDLRMSFQLILSDASTSSCGTAGDFDVEFRFEECGWETGDESSGSGGFGGVPAQSGFDAGDRTNYVALPGSRMNGISNRMCAESNVGSPGVWRFQIRSGVVSCPDAGQTCSTGLEGTCGVGRTACVGDDLECIQSVDVSAETCDRLDNDCDGFIDEGSELCGSRSQCVDGLCVGVCFEGACPAGQICGEDNRCVAQGCENHSCGAGEICRDGVCLEVCEAVRCPLGLTCLEGRCVDLCRNTTCDASCSVCEGGACIPLCQPGSCEAGKVCGEQGRCIEEDCLGVSCAAGFVCHDGGCVDPCFDAVCPDGQTCRSGNCVARVLSAKSVDAGLSAPDGAGVIDFGTPSPPPDSGAASNDGCGCRATSASGVSTDTLLACLVFAFLYLRRRRKNCCISR